MIDRQTNQLTTKQPPDSQPADGHTEMRVHRKVTLQIIILDFILYQSHFKRLNGRRFSYLYHRCT